MTRTGQPSWQRTSDRRSLGAGAGVFGSATLAAGPPRITGNSLNSSSTKRLFHNAPQRKQAGDSAGAVFVLHNIPAKRLFGLKTFWRGSAKVAIWDPARTVIDMLSAPETGGGIDHVAECLRADLNTKPESAICLIPLRRAVRQRRKFQAPRNPGRYAAPRHEAVAGVPRPSYAGLHPDRSRATISEPCHRLAAWGRHAGKALRD